MSRLPAGRAKRTKSPPPARILPAAQPTPPADLPVSMDRRTAALRAEHPAEAADLPEAVAEDSPRIPRGVEASPAMVLPAAADSPKTQQEEEASAANPEAAVLAAQGQKLIRPVEAALSGAVPAARPGVAVSAAVSPRRAAVHRKAPPPGAAASVAVPVEEVSAAQGRKQIHLAAAVHSAEGPVAQPGIPVLEVHPPGPHRKRKCLRPAPQEQGRPPSTGRPGIRATGSQPGTAGMGTRSTQRPPAAELRHSRNVPPSPTASSAGAQSSSPAQQEPHRASGKDKPPVKGGGAVPRPGMAGTAPSSHTPPGQKLGGGPSQQKPMRQTKRKEGPTSV